MKKNLHRRGGRGGDRTMSSSRKGRVKVRGHSGIALENERGSQKKDDLSHCWPGKGDLAMGGMKKKRIVPAHEEKKRPTRIFGRTMTEGTPFLREV